MSDIIQQIKKNLQKSLDSIYIEDKGLYYKLSTDTTNNFIPPEQSIKISQSVATYVNQYTIDGFIAGCPVYKSVYDNLTRHWGKFPNCCPLHQNLSKEPWFNFDENYYCLHRYIMRKLNITVIYTNSLHNVKGGLNELQKFLEYMIVTFGVPSIGADWYLESLYKILTDNNCNYINIINKAKWKKFSKYIKKKADKANPKSIPRPDKKINALIDIYREWLELLPKIEPLKESIDDYEWKFMNTILYEPQFNHYLGWTKFKIKNKDRLLESLFDLTKQILDIDTREYIKSKVKINDFTYKDDIEDEEHRLKQKHLVGQLHPTEEKYVESMYQWLENERIYFERLESRISKSLTNENTVRAKKATQQKPDPSFEDLFRSNSDRVDKFIKILKSDKVQALDNENHWGYNNRKSSIVACFEALENLSITKKLTNKAVLRRVIETKITFNGSEKLFRDHINQDDYNFFYSIFSENIK